MQLFTIGADIEYPLWDKEKNNWVSAIKFIQGTKRRPLILQNNSMLQYDNVALEFAIPIANNVNEFLYHIQTTFTLLKDYLPQQIEIKPISSVLFPEEELTDKRAKEFGCDPDFCVWNGGQNIVNSRRAKNLRTFGGHIHIGAIKSNSWLLVEEEKKLFLQLLDVVLGFTSTVLDNSEESLRRKKLYGRSGAFRSPSYGVEYRTLSNFWTKSPLLTRLMFSLVKDVFIYHNLYDSQNIVQNISYIKIREIINYGIADAALKYLNAMFEVKILSTQSLNLFNLAYEEINQPVSLQTAWLKAA